MPRVPRQHLIELALRFVMIAACVLPLTGLRQAAAAAAPLFANSLPTGQLPTEGEEENERSSSERYEDAIHRVGSRAEYRPDPPCIVRLPATTSTSVRVTSRTCPTPADPFRNGLGTPYRC